LFPFFGAQIDESIAKEERNINNRVDGGGGGGTPHGTTRGNREIILKARLLGLQAVFKVEVLI
jgi:hypothetical protein